MVCPQCQQRFMYVNLRVKTEKINGRPAFPCPRCGAKLTVTGKPAQAWILVVMVFVIEIILATLYKYIPDSSYWPLLIGCSLFFILIGTIIAILEKSPVVAVTENGPKAEDNPEISGLISTDPLMQGIAADANRQIRQNRTVKVKPALARLIFPLLIFLFVISTPFWMIVIREKQWLPVMWPDIIKKIIDRNIHLMSQLENGSLLTEYLQNFQVKTTYYPASLDNQEFQAMYGSKLKQAQIDINDYTYNSDKTGFTLCPIYIISDRASNCWDENEPNMHIDIDAPIVPHLGRPSVTANKSTSSPELWHDFDLKVSFKTPSLYHVYFDRKEMPFETNLDTSLYSYYEIISPAEYPKYLENYMEHKDTRWSSIKIFLADYRELADIDIGTELKSNIETQTVAALSGELTVSGYPARRVATAASTSTTMVLIPRKYNDDTVVITGLGAEEASVMILGTMEFLP